MLNLLFTYKVISKAKRMFLFFKPHEIVQGEEFDLEMTFRNFGEKFHGGFFTLELHYPEPRIVVTVRRVELPSIDEGQSETVTEESLRAEFGSTCVLKLKEQMQYSSDGKTIEFPYLYSSLAEHVYDATAFPLPIATKEELYQKYSVIVALWTATISIVISTLSIVFSIFR